MASVAEQLASNISFSAFKNATELKQRRLTEAEIQGTIIMQVYA